MGWKIYFWCLSILLLFTYGSIFSDSPSAVDFLDAPFSGIALSGLFAFAYGKRFVNRHFWRVWLIVIVCWDLIYNLVFTHYLGIAHPELTGSVAETLMGLVLLMPEYIALYLYGYRSDNLWVVEEV